MTQPSTDLTQYHEYPVRHVPAWTHPGISDGTGQILWAEYVVCWCGIVKPVEGSRYDNDARV